MATAKQYGAAATVTTAAGDELPDHAIAFPTMKSLKDWLRETFTREDTEDRLSGEFFGRRQYKGEKVKDYALELTKLRCRAGINMKEAERTRHFMRGLRKRLRLCVEHFIKEGRESVKEGDWESTVRVAAKIERQHPGLSEGDDRDNSILDLRDMNAMRAVEATAGASDAGGSAASASAHEEREEENGTRWNMMVNAITNLTEALAVTKTERVGRELDNAGRSRRCYNCHESGHLSYECPQAPTPETLKARAQRSRPAFKATCYACNEVGHYANACPNRQGSRGNDNKKAETLPGKQFRSALKPALKQGNGRRM